MEEDPPPVVWRTKLRSTRPDPPVNWEEQVAHCLDQNLIGIGWGLDDLEDGAQLGVVLAAIEARTERGWGARSARIVRRFGEQAQIGDFVWTRDTRGRYLLCRISGEYRYDVSTAATAVDVHQVRAADWAPTPLNDLDVPGGVIRCFIGTGESFSRVLDLPARRFTLYLWETLHGRKPPKLNVTREEILASYLDPQDVEDLVYVWLQVARGYLALPRSRQRDMPAYEYTMIHREGGRRAIAQVKTGATPVNLAALASAAVDEQTDTYAFATSADYVGEESRVTEIITMKTLLQFVRDNETLLPPRVRSWFRFGGN
jgi:hypothetical protein